MRSALRNLTILILSSLFLAACGETGSTQVAEAQRPPSPQSGSSATGIQGKVLSTMDSGGYTYVRIQVDGKEIWAAGPTTVVQPGDQITVVGAMEMKDFHSKTLDRTFESLWFASKLVKAGEATSMAGDEVATAHAGVGAAAVGLMVTAGSIPKAADGYSVAELFAKRKDLSMKQVSVRGKVVKFNPNIMGKNWLHIQDGTGEPGANDLTLTCDTAAKVGDIILVRGSLALEKDFGAGYKYAVMIEDAQITVED